MRLLRSSDDGIFNLVEFSSKGIQPHDILSHTWGPDNEEFTLKDIRKSIGNAKARYAKIQYRGKEVVKDDLQYFYVEAVLSLQQPLIHV
ncbi:hypothetical protein CC78DRAFT_475079 [Lojkania enalia]|uniref:Uncharacterized protein n=1 Tax=Lojkania enalia TaxID=147567 RepID=A0A9P4MZL1_9PLEO|nr:hypothetical protein CC78DRAFT_475079 [Didymosphaeria enalia]